jgi:excisionase family DNA binding protein
MPTDAFGNVEPLVVRPNVAMRLLDCSRESLYELINAGEIQSYRDGSARKITVKSIHDLIERRLGKVITA